MTYDDEIDIAVDVRETGGASVVLGYEVRLADGATNPYLLPAAILAAGLDGIATEADPGKRVDLDMYAEGHKVRGAKKLPLNLLDALRELELIRAFQESGGAVAYLPGRPTVR